MSPTLTTFPLILIINNFLEQSHFDKVIPAELLKNFSDIMETECLLLCLQDSILNPFWANKSILCPRGFI
jgi:hypothetical protein